MQAETNNSIELVKQVRSLIGESAQEIAVGAMNFSRLCDRLFMAESKFLQNREPLRNSQAQIFSNETQSMFLETSRYLEDEGDSFLTPEQKTSFRNEITGLGSKLLNLFKQDELTIKELFELKIQQAGSEN